MYVCMYICIPASDNKQKLLVRQMAPCKKNKYRPMKLAQDMTYQHHQQPHVASTVVFAQVCVGMTTLPLYIYCVGRVESVRSFVREVGWLVGWCDGFPREEIGLGCW